MTLLLIVWTSLAAKLTSPPRTPVVGVTQISFLLFRIRAAGVGGSGVSGRMNEISGVGASFRLVPAEFPEDSPMICDRDRILSGQLPEMSKMTRKTQKKW